MFRRLASAMIAFPAAILLVTLAVNNRQPVSFVVDPLNIAGLQPIALPFYVYLLVALMAGVLLGGFSVWLTQGRFRRSARVHNAEARRWRTEADRLTRERDATVQSHVKAIAHAKERDAA